MPNRFLSNFKNRWTDQPNKRRTPKWNPALVKFNLFYYCIIF
ncbi:hypothetical protein CLOSTMETH_01619 [[Clostridium] methylpentosum DSM 5476]|uniref:Uncharacterized protein n=1 Tax=[Clostridium] methylpentosum DSM 5476 TaxID=537013 RepID=C0ECP8_9FIRM|nr:hypothetical protein CLOSTMETH_01619 [[Clostridium] methylpentosum DSM 5476]